jgi:hypothetical protein
MILPFDYIGYKRLSENKCFPNHRWYSDATWGEGGEWVKVLHLQYFPFLLKWFSWMTTFNNLKTYLPSALKHLSGCHFKILWKKRNIIVTFQSGQLTEQPKTLDDLGRFNLKFSRNNCPIRIEIITGSHIFI